MTSRYSFASVVEGYSNSIMNEHFVSRSARRHAAIYPAAVQAASTTTISRGRLRLRDSDETFDLNRPSAPTVKMQCSEDHEIDEQIQLDQTHSTPQSQNTTQSPRYSTPEASSQAAEPEISRPGPSPTMSTIPTYSSYHQRSLRSKGTFSSTDTAFRASPINPLSPTKLVPPANLTITPHFSQPLTPPLTPLLPTHSDAVSIYTLSDCPSAHQQSPFRPRPISSIMISTEHNVPDRRSTFIPTSPLPHLAYAPSSPPSSVRSSLDLRRPLSPLPPTISLDDATLPDLDNLSLYSTDSAAPPPISLGVHRRGAGDHVCVPLTTLNRRVDSGYSEGYEAVAPIPNLGPRVPTGAQKKRASLMYDAVSSFDLNEARQQHQEKEFPTPGGTGSSSRFSSLRARLVPSSSPSPSPSTAKSLLRSLTQRRKHHLHHPNKQQEQEQEQEEEEEQIPAGRRQRPQLPTDWLTPSTTIPTSPSPSPSSLNINITTTTTTRTHHAEQIKPDAIRLRGREYPLSALRPVSAGEDSAIGGYTRPGGRAQVVLIGGTEFEIRSGETREKVGRVVGEL